MPRCATKYHGEMEFEDQSVVRFPLGLFSFESEDRFLLIEQEALHPLVFLQSLQTPELCFLSLPVFVVDRDYRLEISEKDRQAIGLPSGRQPRIGEEVLCLALVVIQPNGPTTANLMAPVVVNMQTRTAIQAISERDYSHRYPLPLAQEEVSCS